MEFSRKSTLSCIEELRHEAPWKVESSRKRVWEQALSHSVRVRGQGAALPSLAFARAIGDETQQQRTDPPSNFPRPRVLTSLRRI